jgi:hypothetical protein
MKNLKLNELGLDRIYSVYNNSGSLLLYTTSGRMANFVADHARSVDSDMRLRVGGDPGTRNKKQQGVWIRLVNK